MGHLTLVLWIPLRHDLLRVKLNVQFNYSEEWRVGFVMKKAVTGAAAAVLACSLAVIVGASDASAGTAEGRLLVKAPAGVQSVGADARWCSKVVPGKFVSTRGKGDFRGQLSVYSDDRCGSPSRGWVFVGPDAASTPNYLFTFTSADIRR
ncbi:hypothetical protein [Streptomyces sp. NPDC005799]|uniref:hypothetical protein n=1 Tax=Streptomyces sp. NPDC005799 TaxID=3154678 RepID=UPI0033C0695C